MYHVQPWYGGKTLKTNAEVKLDEICLKITEYIEWQTQVVVEIGRK